LPTIATEGDRAGMSRADRGAPCRLFAALRAQALAPRQAQIRRIWRVGACDHLCTATVVTLVFLTGIDGAGDRSRRPDHPRRLVAAVRSVLGHRRRSVAGVIPGGLSQLLGSGCPSGLPPAARNRAPPPPGAKLPRDHAGQRADRDGPAGAAGAGAGLPGRVAAGAGRAGTGVGTGLSPSPRERDPYSGRRVAGQDGPVCRHNMAPNSGNELLVFRCGCSVSDTHRNSAAEGGQLPGLPEERMPAGLVLIHGRAHGARIAAQPAEAAGARCTPPGQIAGLAAANAAAVTR
jgi:hypothetical protein